MSFLKRRKKEKTRRAGEAVAPVAPLQSSAAFSHTGEQITPSHAEALTVHRQSQVSVSTPDIYHEFSTLQGPHRASTPRKPKDYKRKRGIVSIFSRKKSSSLPQLPIPQGLPPVPIPLHPDGSSYRPQVKHFTADTHAETTDALYQNEQYMAVRTSTPLQSSEDPYPLYSTIRTDPVTGTKATVRNVAVNTPVRSVVSSSSAPDGADRAVGEQLTAGDLSTGHREYQNQDPVRGPAEAREIPLDTQNASTKMDSSGIEQTLQLLSRQQQQLLESLQLQQRSAGERDTRSHANDAKQSEERHAKRQSRITADTDPTTSSLNQSADPGNSLLPGNRVDGIQYYFVPGTEGNGYLLPVGPEGRPPSKHNTLSSEPIRTETHSVRASTSDQLVQYLQERQVELESKLVELTEQNAQLSAQVGVIYRAPTPSDEVNTGTEIAYLRQECDRLRENANPAFNFKRELTDSVTHKRCTDCVYRERELGELKKIVFRLNVELSRYQSLYGEHPLVASNLPLQQLGSENAPWLSNTSYLSPLLAAYDEQLNEKNTLLRELQTSVTELQSLADSLESRNSELEREVTSRPLPDQLERSRQQLQLLKEENTILSRDLHTSQQDLMQLRARAKHELEQSDERVSRLEREAERHKSHLSSLKSKLESERVSYSDKINSLKEQLSHSDSQCSKMQSKLREVAASISKKESMVCDQKAAISVLEGKSSAAANSVRALKQKISILERELEVSRSNELTAKGYLEDVVSLVERTATERDTYAKLASKHGHSSHHVSSLQDNSMKRRLDKLRETAQIRMKISSEGDSINESEKQTNEEELSYTRSLLAEKEREISVLREARETAENKLDGFLLSLPKQHTNSI